MPFDEAFYSARPQVKVAGTENPDLAQAILALVVNLPLSGVAHAELTVSNWIQQGEDAQVGFGFQQIGLGETLEILLPDQGSDVRVFKGEITALEERYGEGAPQLIILLQDKLHRLTRTRQSRVFEEQSLDDVVNAVASGASLTADVSLSSVVATYHQLNESDMAFLMRISGSLDIAARLQDDQLRVRPEQADSEPVELDAQDSARKIRLIADLNHQPRSVKVNGHNLDNDENVSETGASLRTAAQGTTAATTLNDLGWDGEEIVPQPFPRSQGEAEALAKAHFNRAAKRFISGDIQAVGEASLRAGREIQLSGVSPRLAGRYQIVNCIHKFDNVSGFETHLKVNRADWQP